MSSQAPTIKENSFNRFATKVALSIATNRALNSLEQHHGLNAAPILFCLWYADKHSKKLTQKQAKEVLSMAAYWHERIVTALHSVQKKANQLRSSTLATDIRKLTQQALDEAHQYEQIMLVNSIQTPDNEQRSLRRVVTDACQNLATLCKLMQTRLDLDDCEAITLLLITAFPEFNFEKASQICKKHLYRPSKTPPAGQTQLRLKL